jgi:hypothetical protein
LDPDNPFLVIDRSILPGIPTHVAAAGHLDTHVVEVRGIHAVEAPGTHVWEIPLRNCAAASESYH